MKNFKKNFFFLFALLLTQGCAREKSFDVEQIATGG